MEEGSGGGPSVADARGTCEGVVVVGVDVGGVLIAIAPGATDTMFSGDHRSAAAVPGAVEGVAALVTALGPHRVFIISKAGDAMAQRTREWLEATEFHARTGLLPSNVHFTRERSGKGPVARDLGVNVMIDDRLDCIQYVQAAVGPSARGVWLQAPPPTGPNSRPALHADGEDGVGKGRQGRDKDHKSHKGIKRSGAVGAGGVDGASSAVGAGGVDGADGGDGAVGAVGAAGAGGAVGGGVGGGGAGGAVGGADCAGGAAAGGGGGGGEELGGIGGGHGGVPDSCGDAGEVVDGDAPGGASHGGGKGRGKGRQHGHRQQHAPPQGVTVCHDWPSIVATVLAPPAEGGTASAAPRRQGGAGAAAKRQGGAGGGVGRAGPTPSGCGCGEELARDAGAGGAAGSTRPAPIPESVVLVDRHCHLNFPRLVEDVPGVVARAQAAGVRVMVSISVRVQELPTLIGYTEAYDGVFCSVGTHPHNAGEPREMEVTVEDLVRLAQHPKVVSIGEAGLDYFYLHSPREAQMAGFIRHIHAARITGLPLEIHTRDADEDTARVLEEETASGGPFPAILHCYTGGAGLAARAVALGHYVSFSGIVTFKRSTDLRTLAASLPLDRILIETDAPNLAPEPFRGKVNEPRLVVHVAAAVAGLRGMTTQALLDATTANFFRLFTKVPRELAPPSVLALLAPLG